MSTTFSKKEINRQIWRERIDRWHQSGKSQKEYCKQQHLGLSSFRRWRRIFEIEVKTAATPKLGPHPEGGAYMEKTLASNEQKPDSVVSLESLPTDVDTLVDSMLKNEPTGELAGLPPVPPKKGIRIIADLETELRRNGLEPDLIDQNIVLLPKWLFLFPRVHVDDDEHRYMRRVRARSGLLTLTFSVIAVLVVTAIASMIYTADQLYFTPRQEQLHNQLLESEFQEIIDRTRLAIDPVNPEFPEWLWPGLSPDWYIEDAVYARPLDLSDKDVELLSFLRKKKAIVAREIEPSYSNDKIQNHLRDRNVIYFGRDYDTVYHRFMNMVLAISTIAREHNATPGLDMIYTSKRRAELIKQVTYPTPNPYFDNRVESMLASLRHEPPLIGESGAVISRKDAEHDKFISMLDAVYNDVGPETFDQISDRGLGPLLPRLPYGWGSTNLTRAFYEDRRQRRIDWTVLELRLLLLDLIFSAEQLPQGLSLVHLYLFHLGGTDYQTQFAKAVNKKLLAEATNWVSSDIALDNVQTTREQRFMQSFSDNAQLKLDDPEDATERRLALVLLSKAARFEHTYKIVESAAEDLMAKPFVSKMGLPVRRLNANNIKPWGLFKARRNGYAHKGLDIGGELGEPALAVMDGTIVRAGFQRGGAGNYLVLGRDNIEVTYMHLLREPSRSNYKPLLSREELKEVGNNSGRGYELALKKYASMILDKSLNSLTEKDLDLNTLRENSRFDRILAAIRKGNNPEVRRGALIGNIGLSGNVTQNSARPEMIYPHIHLEVNGGRIDPMKVIEGIGSRWFEIRDHHLNNPFYRNWLTKGQNWNWYNKLYPSKAMPDNTNDFTSSIRPPTTNLMPTDVTVY
ncbi:MAG: murein DD-endopeptidase MepM/ murein hydrolase activator NlpD [Planctomycetaceae bacterium]|jgi:murein DD-endopeptidase MepM/ murein hydrolase activator NlpD